MTEFDKRLGEHRQADATAKKEFDRKSEEIRSLLDDYIRDQKRSVELVRAKADFSYDENGDHVVSIDNVKMTFRVYFGAIYCTDWTQRSGEILVTTYFPPSLGRNEVSTALSNQIIRFFKL